MLIIPQISVRFKVEYTTRDINENKIGEYYFLSVFIKKKKKK